MHRETSIKKKKNKEKEKKRFYNYRCVELQLLYIFRKKTLDEKLMCLALMKHATNLDEKKLIQRNIQKRSIHIDLMYQVVEEKMEVREIIFKLA